MSTASRKTPTDSNFKLKKIKSNLPRDFSENRKINVYTSAELAVDKIPRAAE